MDAIEITLPRAADAAPSQPPLYAVRMCSGDPALADTLVTIVGVTADFEKAKAYVAQQEARQASLVAKYSALAESLNRHLVAHPCPRPCAEEDSVVFQQGLRDWLAEVASFRRAWLAEHLTSEESILDAAGETNEWCIEPVAWLA